MIETPHARVRRRRPRARVPLFSLYSDTREPTPEMLRDVDTLVIDLQDIGTRIYTYAYTMANCMRAAQAARHQGDRLRSAESDRRHRDRRHHARAWLRILRRPVSDSDAPRHDHRRAGAALQRALRHRRRPRGRRRWTAGRASMYWDDTGLAVGDAVAEHSDARQRDGLSRHGACRRHQRVRGPRDDASLRAGRRAVGQGREVCGRAQRARAARRRISGPSCSSRRFRSTRAWRAAAARFTCSIARRSSRC